MKSFPAIAVMMLTSVSLCAKTPLQYSSIYEMIDDQKLRAAYFHDYDVSEEHLDELKNAGINGVMVKIYAGKPSSKEFFDSIIRWAKAIEKRDMQMFVVINYVYFDFSDLPNCIGPSGKTYKFPSFTSEAYWERIGKCMEQIAELSKKHKAITAILVDCEHYNNFDTVSPEAVSYQKDMAAEFAAYKKLNLPAGDVNYYEFFGQHKLCGEYEKYFIGKFNKTLVTIREKSRKINPALGLGYLPPCYIPENWFQVSLLESWGTKEQPLIIFDERTYAGYRNTIGEVAKKTSEQFNAIYLPGISIEGRFENTPGRLASQLYDIAKAAQGYWIYTTYQLSPECLEKIKTGKDDVAYSLTTGDSPEYFLKAIKMANLAIDLWMHNPQQAMEMTTAAKKVKYPQINGKDLKSQKFKIIKKGNSEKVIELPSMREIHSILIAADMDEKIDILLSQMRIGYYDNEGCTWMLLSPRAEKISSGRIAPDKKCKIEYIAKDSGVYRLVINPGLAASAVSTRNAVAVLVDRARLYCYEGKLYLEKIGGIGKAQFGIVADAKDETVEFRLRDSAGQLLGHDAGEIDLPVWVNLSDDSRFILELSPWKYGKYEDVRILTKNAEMIFSTISDMPLLEEIK